MHRPNPPLTIAEKARAAGLVIILVTLLVTYIAALEVLGDYLSR